MTSQCAATAGTAEWSDGRCSILFGMVEQESIQRIHPVQESANAGDKKA
jgi:hypothetical protein